MTIRHFTVPPRALPVLRGERPAGRALARLAAALLAAAMALPAGAAGRPAGEPAADPLESALAAEFAVSAGRVDEAVARYLDAAEAAPGDAGLAARATRLALAGSDDAALARALALWRDRAPPSTAMTVAEATLALRTGRLREARAALETLLATPGPGGWRLALAVLQTGGRDPALSARLLDALVRRDALPATPQAWPAFAALALALDDPGLYARIDARGEARFPGDPRLGLVRARHLRGEGRLDEARRITAGIAASPALADPDLRVAVALEHAAQGDAELGAALLGQVPQDTRLLGLKAAMLAEAGDTAGLEALYAGLEAGADAPDPARRMLLGQIAEFLERPADALRWYESVPGGEERPAARLRAAKSLHDLGRGDDAYAALDALQQDAVPGDEPRRDAWLLESELRRMDADAGRGPATGEVDALSEGLAAFPDDPALLYARALAWERRDDIARAEADLRRILVAEPDDPAALNALGYTLADRTTRYQEALELIERARLAEPGNAAIIDSYGWVLHRLGRHEDALVELRRAFVLQRDAEIAAHIGEVLWVLGRKEEARHWFDEAAAIDPDNRSLRRALEVTGA
jgi:tetratricopeptide (TPR) repeat protein